MALSRKDKYSYNNYGSKYYKDKRPWKNTSRTDAKSKHTSYFLLFFLSAITIVSLLFNSLFVSFFNSSKISKSLCSTDIYISVQKQAKEKYEAILKDTGIPASVISNTLDSSYIEQDMKVFVGNSDGIFDRFDLSQRRKLMREDIEKYYTSKGIAITTNISQKTESLLNKLLDSYASCVNLSFWPRFLEIRYTVSSYTFYVEVIFLALIILIIASLYVKNKKYIHRFFRYMCEYCWTVAFALALISLSDKILDITISPAFSEQQQCLILFENLSNNYFAALWIFSIISLAVGCVFFAYSIKKRKELIYRYSHRHTTANEAEEFHNEIIDFIESGKTKQTNEISDKDDIPDN